MPRSCSYNDDLLPSEILTPKGGITAKIQISPKHQKWESPSFSDNRYSLYLAHPPACLSFPPLQASVYLLDQGVIYSPFISFDGVV
jgi:hypothetical protein